MFTKSTKEIKNDLNQLQINTVIAGGISIAGDIKGETAIRIDGNVEGNVDMKKGIVIGDKSIIKGSLNSDAIIVFGKLIGNLKCKTLQIKNTGIIEGDIIADSLEVEMGGMYNGTLKMDTATKKSEEKKTN
ncbi:bactofilin family protein [Moheibacter sediminis]|uniref:Protein CcmA, bactofilin family n=1 Tax=Moheibacter sediminis TaxID=1434700 RepID=A0A1W1YN32_9FLAO|nr:polymer-forming cytoskeletal protein [Moheibacter sediminis]SMC37526.1 protein CcmA, bactofilin family [Moheibacter sediminis]